MTRDEIRRIAKEAGYPDYVMGLASEEAWEKTERFTALVIQKEREACMRETERLAVLIAAAEREACAKVCEERGKGWLEVKNARTIDEGCMHAAAKAEATALAAAIRARREE